MQSAIDRAQDRLDKELEAHKVELELGLRSLFFLDYQVYPNGKKEPMYQVVDPKCNTSFVVNDNETLKQPVS